MFSADSDDAEEPERRPDERDRAEDPESRRADLDLLDDARRVVDRAGREGRLQLLDQVARLVGLAEAPISESARKRRGTNASSREVGDHRGQVRPAVGEELPRGWPAIARVYDEAVLGCPPWTRRRRSPTSSRSRPRSTARCSSARARRCSARPWRTPGRRAWPPPARALVAAAEETQRRLVAHPAPRRERGGRRFLRPRGRPDGRGGDEAGPDRRARPLRPAKRRSARRASPQPRAANEEEGTGRDGAARRAGRPPKSRAGAEAARRKEAPMRKAVLAARRRRRGRGAMLRRRPPERRARRPLLRGRLDGVARRRLRAGRPARPARPRRARGRAGVNDADLAALLRERAYLEGDFVLRSGRRSSLLPGQVPLRDAAGRCSRALGERIAAQASRRGRAGPPGRARARRGRARGRGVARVGAPLPDRPQGREGLRHGEPDRGRLRGRASASASSRMS